MTNIAFCGFRHVHIFALYALAKANPDVKIIAAFEENAEARAAAEAKGVVFTHDSYEAMLAEKDIDIIAIGDYFGIRGSRAIAALKAGKNVYSDKPLCTSLDELDQIEALVKKTGLKVGCMLDVRYHQWVQPIKKFIAEGKLGEINSISFGGQHPLLWGSRAGWYFEKGKHGGTINDIAIHGIDLVEYLTGLGFKRVIGARCWNGFAKEAPDFKDCGQYMAELSNGAGLMADVSYAAPDSCGYSLPTYWRFTVWGTKGVMEFCYGEKDFRVALNGTGGFETVKTPDVDTGNCLAVFLDELAGKPAQIDTVHTIAVSRETLLIQQEADK
ncbi:MAG: Gfo/Idh/MocA family oxidoreductase [Oscillospiraceae bacterium]|nr:Gfo/Idh/MocA family oxidoreductase [Oscillospiraceae bacterium]